MSENCFYCEHWECMFTDDGMGECHKHNKETMPDEKCEQFITKTKESKMEKPNMVQPNPTEISRKYWYLNKEKAELFCITFENIIKLGVSKSGTHRLEDSEGIKYIVPKEWLYIELVVAEWTL